MSLFTTNLNTKKLWLKPFPEACHIWHRHCHRMFSTQVERLYSSRAPQIMYCLHQQELYKQHQGNTLDTCIVTWNKHVSIYGSLHLNTIAILAAMIMMFPSCKCFRWDITSILLDDAYYFALVSVLQNEALVDAQNGQKPRPFCGPGLKTPLAPVRVTNRC